MATNFPTSVDSFTNPTAVDTLDSPPHDQQHADANDAIEAIETALLDGAPLHIDDANERIGIGTATPAYKLDVKGQVQVGSEDDITPDAFGNGHLMIDGAAYTGFASLDSTAMWVGHNSNGRSLYLATDETARVTVTGVGNVGINDTSPSYTLDVNGDINATGDLRIGGTAIGATTTYTPTLTNFTVSSQAVQYAAVNNLVFVRFYFTISAVTGTPVLTVPSGFNILGFPQHQTCNLLEVGVDNYQGVVSFSSSTSVSISSINASTTYAKTGAVNGSTPFNWGAGDVISGGFWYLAV